MQGGKGDDEIKDKMAELVMVCDKESEIRQQRLQNDTLSLHESLHSSKSIADQTISIKGMTTALKFMNRHNSVLTIDVQDQTNAYYHEILNFLLRSRIHHLITHNPVVVASYIRDFWTSAHYDSAVNPTVIRATVNGQPLAFSLVDLRNILQLGDAAQDNERMEFPATMRARAFGRMGYNGDATRIIKSGLYGQWRFLAHVVIQCLGAKKAGFDAMNAREQSLMIALVYNKPYSFSRYFFEAFRDLLERGGRDKFLMFPRFVMMIILDRLPGIPIVGGTLGVTLIGGRIFADCRMNKTGRPIAVEIALFGHLVNENYVAPPNDGWDDIPVVQQEREMPDIGVVGAEAAAQQPQPHAQPQQQAPPVVADEQVLVDDLLDQDVHPHQAVAEEIVQAVLQENAPVEDVLEDVLADVENFQGDNALEDLDDNDGDKTDSDASERESDDDDAPDYTAVHKKFVLGGKELVVKESGPPHESSSHGKRKVNKDDDYTPTGEDDQDVDESSLRPRKTKRWRSTSGIVISEPTEHAVDIPIQTATTETTTTATTSETTQIPISTIPKAAIPTSPFLTANVSDTLRIAGLEAQIAALNAQVAMLNAVVAKQDECLQSMNHQINEVLEEKIARNEYLILGLMRNQPTRGEKLSCKGDELREKSRKDKDNDPSESKNGELTSSSTTPLGTLATSQGESSKQGDRSEKAPVEVFETIEALIGIDEMMEDNDKDVEVEEDEDEFLPMDVAGWKSNDEVMSDSDDDIDEHVIPKTTEVVYVNDAGSLPKITSNPQEATIISMSAPFSSVSTDSGSSAKDDHSRQANRVGRKLRNVQGIQSSVLSPGSASSLRRSPRFKVKK